MWGEFTIDALLNGHAVTLSSKYVYGHILVLLSTPAREDSAAVGSS